MNKQKLGTLAALFTSILSISTFSYADNSENSKLVGMVDVLGDASVVFQLQSPSSTLTNACAFLLLQISASSPAKTLWMSQLLTAKASQIPVSVTYTPAANNNLCQITTLTVN